jgi:hypothetical protein
MRQDQPNGASRRRIPLRRLGGAVRSVLVGFRSMACSGCVELRWCADG